MIKAVRASTTKETSKASVRTSGDPETCSRSQMLPLPVSRVVEEDETSEHHYAGSWTDSGKKSGAGRRDSMMQGARRLSVPLFTEAVDGGLQIGNG